VTGLNVLQSDESDDVTSLGTIEFLAGVSVHLNDAANTLGLTSEGVQDGVSLIQNSGVDTGEGQGTELVVHDLKRQRSERPVVLDFGEGTELISVDVHLRLGRNFGRARKVVDDSVEDQLDTLVLEG